MTRAGILTLGLLTVVLFGMAAAAHVLTGDWGDKGWEMLYAHRWLNGARMHRDIFPVSPPLIFWIYAIPAALSSRFPVASDFEWLSLLGLAATLGSMALSTRLIASAPPFARDRKKQLELAAMLVFVLIIRTNPHYFMDREHIFLVLILPYLVRFLPSVRDAALPNSLRILTGIMAGIGFSIKPHCVVVLIGIDLFCILTEKSFRVLGSIEHLIACGTGVAYLLLVAWCDPTYFTVVVPMLLATYSANRDDTPVWDYLTNALSVLFLTFLMFRLRETSPYRRDIGYLLALCVPFFLYALLNNNWAYTYYPLGSVALILTAFVLWEFLDLKRRAKKKPAVRFVLGAALCLSVFAFKAVLSAEYLYTILAHGCYYGRCDHEEPFTAELKEDGRTLPFGTVSVDFIRWTNVVRASGAEWKTRFPLLWMLPQFFLKDADFAKEHRWILDYVGNAYADDLNSKKPDVMFVDDTNVFYIAHTDVDLVAYLSAVPAFAEAWKPYRFTHSIDLCAPPGMPDPPYRINCRYDVYRREK